MNATGPQLRAARNALGWSIERLAEASGVSVRTIIRYEDTDGCPATRGGNLARLVTTLESAGIEFIGSPDDAPGIRIHAPRRPVGGAPKE
ncbi:MAG: helix-turn-helix domain-containing protein [Rhodobacteraceae bacterium]|nr:helix-turn-helix domain-containing protein [Paracoccaceae bacterium]